MANPTEAARHHFERLLRVVTIWQQQAKERNIPFPPIEQIWFAGANEPNQLATYLAIAEYAKAYALIATTYGVTALVGILGVGHPAYLKPDKSVDWSTFYIAQRAIEAGNHVFEMHGYWQAEGPNNGEDYPYLAGRHHSYPFDSRILIGECGIDGGIYERHPKSGWQAYHLTPQQYAKQLEQNHDQLDARVVAQLPFSDDFQAKEDWATFEVSPAHPYILEWAKQKQVAKPPTTPDPPIVVPAPQPQQGAALDPLIIAAIFNLEARAGLINNRLVIRFEAHIFEKYLNDPTLFAQYFSYVKNEWNNQHWRPLPDEPMRLIHTGNQDDEWAAFEQAHALNQNAAYQSISMGQAQIMGFNYRRLGYQSAKHMFDDFSRSLALQIAGFFNFVLTDTALYSAIQRHDWSTIALRYNGSTSYAFLLEAEYKRLRQNYPTAQQLHLPLLGA